MCKNCYSNFEWGMKATGKWDQRKSKNRSTEQDNISSEDRPHENKGLG